MDLSILGQPPERFWDYERGIRAEYAWVDEEAFATKRTEILGSFLARLRLYHTESFFTRVEAQARANLRASIVRHNITAHRFCVSRGEVFALY